MLLRTKDPFQECIDSIKFGYTYEYDIKIRFNF